MRDSGYYRVKIEGSWEVAKYKHAINGYFGYWRLFNSVEQYSDSDFEAIDENRIDPEPEFKHKEGSRYQFYHITDDRKYAVYNERDKEGYNIEHVVEISRTKEFNKLVSKYPLT